MAEEDGDEAYFNESDDDEMDNPQSSSSATAADDDASTPSLGVGINGSGESFRVATGLSKWYLNGEENGSLTLTRLLASSVQSVGCRMLLLIVFVLRCFYCCL